MLLLRQKMNTKDVSRKATACVTAEKGLRSGEMNGEIAPGGLKCFALQHR